MTISIGFSPCPNDTFIFDALINGKIDTGKYTFKPVLADVEELNLQAFNQNLDVTKLSYFALGKLLNTYQLLRSGSALGYNCGPLLISKQPLTRQDILARTDIHIAIPGYNTTARFLLNYAYPNFTEQQLQPVLFSEIEQAVLHGHYDAGLIIHENRFTYKDVGLQLITDLGEYWQNETGYPIPLGGIAIKRTFSNKVKSDINQLIRKSVEYAFKHPQDGMPYIKKHAQAMDEAVMQQHINLYVNQQSINLDATAQQAIKYLYQTAQAQALIPPIQANILIDA